MVRRTTNGRTTTTNNRAKSNSFALFGDNIVTATSNNTIDLFNKTVKKSKKTDCTKQIGSQHVDEKPESPEFSIKEVGHQAKRGFRSLKINKDNIGSESDSIDVKGQGCSKINGGDKSSGTESRKLKTKDNRSVSKVGRNKRKIQKNERGTGNRKNNNTNSETLDFKKYPIGKFDVTNKIQNYPIQGQPRIIDDFTYEVIIDGKRYKVSPWSIKGGQYIQGLDSIFLVSKYKVGKHK
jgi:hypothetical protein